MEAANAGQGEFPAVDSVRSISTASMGLLCLNSFDRLLNVLQNSAISRGTEIRLSVVTVQDELGRFKIWAGNIGALQPATRASSLEHRLRDASNVRDHIIMLLRDLDFTLNECISITAGDRPQLQSSSAEDGFDEGFSDLSDSTESESSQAGQDNPTSEVEQLYLAIVETITSLLKLSISIRKPTTRDRYAGIASLTPLDPAYDINHVSEKYPRIRSTPWLMEKVGRAITRRRDFLRYRARHHEELADGLTTIDFDDQKVKRNLRSANPNLDTGEFHNEFRLTQGAASSVTPSGLASSKANTFVASFQDSLGLEFSTEGSEISYVTSVADDPDEECRQVPDPPKSSVGGKPFECPYCYTIQVIKSLRHWKKHVMSDLGPYICTFKDCTAQLFHNRQEWAQHENGMHRKEWRCNFCPSELATSETILYDHLRERHPEYTGQQASSLLSLCGKPWDFIPMSCCLFCQWEPETKEQSQPIHPEPSALSPEMHIPSVTSEVFYKHVGHHLEQLALLALPAQTKESSHTFSNYAAVSHLTHETRSQALSLSSKSFHGEEFSEVYLSIVKGDLGRLEKLLSNGASVTAQHPQFGGILQVAAAFGSFEALPLLLKHGADPNVQGGEYGNALQAIAAHSGPRLEALRLLIAHGANVNASGGKFGHALVAAAATESFPGTPEYEPRIEVIFELLLYGADIDARGSNYGTALQVLLANRDMQSAGLLVDRGADPHLQIGECETPSETARRNGDEAFIEYIRDTRVPDLSPFLRNYPHYKLEFAARFLYYVRPRLKARVEKGQREASRHEISVKMAAFKPAVVADKAAAELAETASPAEGTEAPLKFSDPLGRKFSFPFHLCNTWRGMERLIKEVFYNVEKYHPYVDKGMYDLIDPHGEIVDTSTWETAVEPGWSLKMVMWKLPEPHSSQDIDE